MDSAFPDLLVLCAEGAPMPFFNFLKSLDELLYQVMSWLIFYPFTFWRSVRHPLTMMSYAQGQLEKEEGKQFREALSPPIFLLLTVLLAHGVELAVIGNSALISSNQGLSAVINDDTSLVVLRLVSFALLPVLMGTIQLRLAGNSLDRDCLEAPFYAQCYLTSPFALIVSLVATFSNQALDAVGAAALAAEIVAAALYLAIQSIWLARATGRNLFVTLGASLGGLIFYLAALWVLGLMLAD